MNWSTIKYLVHYMFNDKSILITGGTGSFGKKYTKTLLERYKPKKIIINSISQTFRRLESINTPIMHTTKNNPVSVTPFLTEIAPSDSKKCTFSSRLMKSFSKMFSKTRVNTTIARYKKTMRIQKSQGYLLKKSGYKLPPWKKTANLWASIKQENAAPVISVTNHLWNGWNTVCSSILVSIISTHLIITFLPGLTDILTDYYATNTSFLMKYQDISYPDHPTKKSMIYKKDNACCYVNSHNAIPNHQGMKERSTIIFLQKLHCKWNSQNTNYK